MDKSVKKLKNSQIEFELNIESKDWEKYLDQAVITSYSIHYTKLYDTQKT